MKGIVPLFITVIVVSLGVVALTSTSQVNILQSPSGQLSLIDTFDGDFQEGDCECSGSTLKDAEVNLGILVPVNKVKTSTSGTCPAGAEDVTYFQSDDMPFEECSITLDPKGNCYFHVDQSNNWVLSPPSRSNPACTNNQKSFIQVCEKEEQMYDDMLKCLANPKDKSCDSEREAFSDVFDSIKEKCKECRKKAASNPAFTCTNVPITTVHGISRNDCTLSTRTHGTPGSVASWLEHPDAGSELDCSQKPPVRKFMAPVLECQGKCEEK